MGPCGFFQVFLIGGFNDWQNSTPLTNEGFGRWSLFIKDKASKSGIEWKDWKEERMSLFHVFGCFGCGFG